MSEEAKKDQAMDTELSEEQIEGASGGAGFMYFKDSPIVGESPEAGPTDLVSGDDDTREDQTASRPGMGILKSTDGGRTW